jgi:DNA-binding NarL/FixJ family response regulator
MMQTKIGGESKKLFVLLPEISIVMYTQFEDEDKIFRSLCAGADGYILKKTSPIILFQALEEVSNGGAPLSPAIAKKVLASFHTSSNKALRYNLTPREIEVLKLLIKGYSVKYIAAELFICYDTCKSHLKNIYTKLHVNCGKEAIAKVLAERIILD